MMAGQRDGQRVAIGVARVAEVIARQTAVGAVILPAGRVLRVSAAFIDDLFDVGQVQVRAAGVIEHVLIKVPTGC